MDGSVYRRLGFAGLLAGALTLAALAALPRRPVSLSYSAAQLQNDIRKLEANWQDPKWKANVAHEEARKLITRFVTEQLNRGPAAAQAIQKNLASAINDGMPRSWSETPARVLVCCSQTPEIYIVGFTLNEAASDSSLSVIQTYRRRNGSWQLRSAGGSEMEGWDMDLVLLPPEFGDIRVFAYGGYIGGNNDPTYGVLYSVPGDRIRPIWTLKDTEGLSAKVNGGKLILEYIQRYALKNTVQFRDEYVQTPRGLTRISHRPAEL